MIKVCGSCGAEWDFTADDLESCLSIASDLCLDYCLECEHRLLASELWQPGERVQMADGRWLPL